MINGKIDQFLDTGWFSEATLYYNGYIYWCEAQTDNNSNIITFIIDCWKAENEKNLYFHTIQNEDGTVDWKNVCKITGNDLDLIKKQFLEFPAFEGKTFWQVEKQLAWLEESTPIKQ